MENYFHFLKKVHFFSALPDTDILKLESVCKERLFKAGEVIFSEGEPGEHFYIILNGTVEVWKNYKSPQQDLLAVCGPGESFGELALIDDYPRSATIVAQVSTTLLVITRRDFRKVL